MPDLTSRRLIVLKGIAFLVLATMSTTLLLLKTPTLGAAFLLALAIWASCRFYYFAFYVLQHYVDPRFRYAGMLDLLRHVSRACSERDDA